MSEKNKRTCFLVGKGSSTASDFSVWEHLQNSNRYLEEKGVAVGAYFFVGQVSNHKKYRIDISKYDLFLAGHHPYSQSDKFGSFRRGYSRLVTTVPLEKLKKAFTNKQVEAIERLIAIEYSEEVLFCQSNIYKLINDDREFSLMLSNGDWLDSNCMKEFYDGFFKAGSVVKFSEEGVFLYKPNESKGYFLQGLEYVVKATEVGIPDDTKSGHKKKILCIDMLSGVPGLVPYDEGAFTLIK